MNYLYVIGGTEGPQKIGFSKDVKKRLATLQTGNSILLKIHHVEEIPEDRVKLIERKLHKELNYRKLKGEWFDLSIEEACNLVKFARIRWLDDITI